MDTLTTDDIRVLSCVGEGVTLIEYIRNQSGLTNQEVSRSLMRLELKGLIQQLPHFAFRRVAGT